MLIKFFIPLLYCMFMGLGWSLIFNKKFYESLAPALLSHTLFVIIIGLIFERLSLGIYGGIVVMTICIIITAILRHHEIDTTSSLNSFLSNNQISNGLIIFVFFYFLCFCLNTGKYFLDYDEFTHWGMFLKESLRLDNFYCVSNLNFAHKDYVPALTIFENIYCRISGGFAYPQSYRAMQILEFALLFPMFGKIIDFCRKQKDCRNVIFLISSFFFVLITPFIYDNGNGFKFYHSLYCDFVLGIMFFYLVFVAYKDDNNIWYKTLLLTIGISAFILAKMTSIVLFPMVLVLLFFLRLVFGKIRKKNIITYFPMIVVPLSLWGWFNVFVKKYVDTKGHAQSYGNISVSKLIDVFASASDNSIAYIGELRKIYVNAIFTKDIWIKGSYMVLLIFLTIIIASMTIIVKEEVYKKKIAISAVWTFVFGIAYAVLMYFLYATSFSEFEAMILASFERYMNTFLVTIVLFAIAIFFESELWRDYRKQFYKVILIFSIWIFIFNVDRVSQAVPGIVTHEDEKNDTQMVNAKRIMDNTVDGSRVFMIYRGDGGFLRHQITFYCDNRIIDGYSAGPKMFNEDNFSEDVSIDKLVEDVGKEDYIYFYSLDKLFINKYSKAFENPDLLVNGNIYKVQIVDGKIRLE